jgi:hypothetical protein
MSDHGSMIPFGWQSSTPFSPTSKLWMNWKTGQRMILTGIDFAFATHTDLEQPAVS